MHVHTIVLQQMGDPSYCKFIKSYLDDPQKCMNHQFEAY